MGKPEIVDVRGNVISDFLGECLWKRATSLMERSAPAQNGNGESPCPWKNKRACVYFSAVTRSVYGVAHFSGILMRPSLSRFRDDKVEGPRNGNAPGPFRLILGLAVMEELEVQEFLTARRRQDNH